MLSVYLHMPFCLHKCSYCDLNAYAGLNDLIPAYVDALIREIEIAGPGAGARVHTVYLGGGTPSLIPIALLGRVLEAIHGAFELESGCEVSVEANPETITHAYADGLSALGITRLSLGAQSSHLNELALFQRTHTWEDVERAVEAARGAGINNISLDLIYGTPGQTLPAWEATLNAAVALQPEHISAYVLSTDFNTPMRAWIQRGLLPEADDDACALMYRCAGERLQGAGYWQYELSSWARDGHASYGHPLAGDVPGLPAWACRHNLQYWRNLPYLGLGAGAHSFCAGYRFANVANPSAYINRMASSDGTRHPFSPATVDSARLDLATEMNETMLTGLRLVGEGVDSAAFEARFGRSPGEVFAAQLGRLERRGLVEWHGRQVRLTRDGRFVSNWVFECFV